jgi:hypothetical protein
MQVDTSQLESLATRLEYAPTKKRPLVKAAIKKGAQNIKEAIQADVKTSSNRAIRRISIGYDMHETVDTVEADIGPRDGGASNLANFAFFGTSKGGGSHEFYPHGEREMPATAEYVHRAAMGL